MAISGKHGRHGPRRLLGPWRRRKSGGPRMRWADPLRFLADERWWEATASWKPRAVVDKILRNRNGQSVASVDATPMKRPSFRIFQRSCPPRVCEPAQRGERCGGIAQPEAARDGASRRIDPPAPLRARPPGPCAELLKQPLCPYRFGVGTLSTWPPKRRSRGPPTSGRQEGLSGAV